MKFYLRIDSENAAFTGSEGAAEVARLLRQTAERVENGHDCGRLTDYNGNGVGLWDAEATAEYRCADCGDLSAEEYEDTTCRECGRGTIEEVSL